MKRWKVCLALLGMVAAGACWAEPVGFAEKFALAEDRGTVLDELVPGTDDYYFYHCLHAQNGGQLDEAEEWMNKWQAHLGPGQPLSNRTPGREILNRQALLRYPDQPEKTLERIRHELNLRTDHERTALDAQSSLPVSLDTTCIDPEQLTQSAMSRHANHLEGFEDSALDWLAAHPLDHNQRREWLKRVKRPDLPGLVDFIAQDLVPNRISTFGSLEIHRLMLLDQLDELVSKVPALLTHDEFINAYLVRLRPSADEDWQHQPEAREAYLSRLQAFTDRLPSSQRTLKGQVLYHRLVHDLGLGVYDKERFLAYIALPRNAHYVNPVYVRQQGGTGLVDLNQNFSAVTLLPPPGSDEPLIRAYLQHFFATEDSFEPYATYLTESYLREVFAETKILEGQGDMEQWSSWLTPANYQALKDRVIVDFDPANPTFFNPEDPVSLNVWVKNVSNLLVKVYEIDTKNYYCSMHRHVNTDIDLDGIVANAETTHTYDLPPTRRVLRRFDFPDLARRGVFVIEFIGNGVSSRAVIRKGRLSYVVKTTPAGHVITILDEKQQRVDDATIWLEGHEYKAGKEGRILVPFSREPHDQPIVISQGDFSYPDSLQQEAEAYELTAAIYVDQESLRPGHEAEVGIRPALYLNGSPVTARVLQEPVLEISSVDWEGVPTKTEVRDLELCDDQLLTHSFRVPANLRTITFSLRTKVKKRVGGQMADLAVSREFQVNQIDATPRTEALLLQRVGDGYRLALLGKTGEPRGGRPIYLELKHRDFVDWVHVTLRTDEAGYAHLGRLPGIVEVRAKGPDQENRNWPIRETSCSYLQALHGYASGVFRIPYTGQEAAPSRAEFSLLEVRGPAYVTDCFEALSIEGGFVTVQGLAPGIYALFLKREDVLIHLTVTQGIEESGYVVSDYRQFQAANPHPLHLVDVRPEGDHLRIQIANPSAFSRVHVAATHFVSDFPIEDYLRAGGRAVVRARTLPAAESVYISGRNIGDEHRYVLNRRQAQLYPGNSLERPGLLISPWSIGKTTKKKEQPAPPEAPAPSAEPASAQDEKGGQEAAALAGPTGYFDPAFLGGDSAVFLNLEPNEAGLVEIPLAHLAGRSHIHVVVTDPRTTISRSIALPENGFQLHDVRLAKVLNTEEHLAQQKRISILKPAETLTISRGPTTRFEVYDTVAKLHRLYMALSQNPALAEFEFIGRWPAIDRAEQERLYAKYACHELNLFLFKKDPAFFDSVVRPFITNKLHKTFLDSWLIGEDLAPFLQPSAFQKLNTAERILLGERIDGEAQPIARLIRERCDLLPPDPDREDWLFATALQGRVLEAPAGPAPMLDYDISDAGVAELKAGCPAGALKHISVGGEISVRDDLSEGGGVRDIERGSLAREEVRQKAPPPAASAAGIRSYRPSEDMTGNGLGISGFTAMRYSRATTDLEELMGSGYVGDIPVIGAFFEQLSQTETWVENNYYRCPLLNDQPDLIQANAFWRDLAARDRSGPFLPASVAEASHSFPEMMFALALVDLPFEAQAPALEADEDQYRLTAARAALVFHQEILEAGPAEEQKPILLSQNYFRLNERFRVEDGQQIEKFVEGEFLIDEVYGCIVAVTNTTSSPQRVEVLHQIPEGAVPVLAGSYTKSRQFQLGPHQVVTIEYHFYFPAPGEFHHYPAHITHRGRLIACEKPNLVHVVPKASTVDTSSWEYISREGTEDQVIAFLEQNNLQAYDLGRIAWRMKDSAFYQRVLDLLDHRHVFNRTLASYALLHHDVPTIRELLQARDGRRFPCGRRLESELLTFDGVSTKTYEHKEFAPLVNARAHQLGPERTILDQGFFNQYQDLMECLAYQPVLTQDDCLEVTYYLFLQDRVEEALAFFARVDPAQVESTLQYDYVAAYAAFYQEDLGKARTIAEAYEDYPVPRWQKRFAAVLSQLDEVEGADPQLINEDDHAQRQTQRAASEPSFEFQVTNEAISIRYQNLQECRVNYHLMDLELLFSRSPFAREHSDHVALVKPSRSDLVALPAESTSHEIPLPEELRGKNVTIEIEGVGIKRMQAHYAHNLALQVIENYGQVCVNDAGSGKPLPKVYVKAFAKLRGGGVCFYKDGYTDLRGRFDYASLNTNVLDQVERFALLVLSEDHGATVREARPPAR